jgi:hypothetical protein
MKATRFVSRLIIAAVGAMMLIAAAASADTLVLKDGTVVQGMFKSGDETKLVFYVEGADQEYALWDITNLTFAPRTPPAPPAPPAPSPPPVAATKGAVTIPAGTKIMIKTTSKISTASHKSGTVFEAVLELGITVDETVVVPAGTPVYGVVLESDGGHRRGPQKILLTFNKLIVDGKSVVIVTEDVGAEGGKGGAGRKVGAGVLIGAAAGGSSGAAKGAAVGGALSLLGPGNHIEIPAETLVEVSLKQAVSF